MWIPKSSLRGGVVAWTDKTQCVIPWLVRLSTGSIKIIKNTNNFSIFNCIPWSSIPWSSHGMTKVKLVHATMPCEERSFVAI
ncbi:hypothetical protein [Candidatus Rickettsia kedanie]|uniref:hypothetical protein n=1 Tax=Candidatus Rickettsia kedanie TaxID=3115352 RepID=UPI00399D11B3